MTIKTVFITSGTTFTIPSDFKSLASIEAIGGGGGGGASGGATQDAGGGGGAYAKITSLSGLIPGGIVSCSIGAGGTGGVDAGSGGNGTAGGNTWLSNTGSVPTNTSQGVKAAAGAPNNGSSGGAGGTTGNSIGTVTNAGGTAGTATNSGYGGVGGAGAGGPNGAGKSSVADIAGTVGGGTGGGAADNGSVGVTNSTNNGGAGGAAQDATAGGTGGTGSTSAPTAGGVGSHGSGGGGGGGHMTSGNVAAAAGGAGGSGIGWIQTSDSAVAGPGGGGGGGGGSTTGTGTGGGGGTGGLYGGGGGAAGDSSAATNPNGGNGANGVIIFTYDNGTIRDWAAADGLTEATTTSATVWTTQATLAFTPKANTAYVIFWSASLQLTSTTVSGQADLYDVTNATELVLQNIEGSEVATPIDYAGVGGIYILAGGSAILRSFSVRFKSATAGTTTKMKNARLVALELTAADAYAEDLTRTTTTAATGAPTTKLTANITVPSGGRDYLIISSCNADVSATDKNYVRHEVDNTLKFTETTNIESAWEITAPQDALNRHMCVQFNKQTLAAGAHSARIRWDVNDSGGTAGLEQARILFLCLNDGLFGENFYNEDVSGAFGEAATTTYASRASISQTLAGGDYLLLGFGTFGTNSITISGYGQLLLDGSTVLDEQMREGLDIESTFGFFGVAKATLSAGSHSLAYQYKVESGTTGNALVGAVIALKLPARTPRDIQSAENLTEQSTTSNSAWTTQTSLTFTPKENADYAILWSAALQLTATSSDGQADLYDVTSGTERVLQNMAAQEIAAPIDYPGVGGQYFHKAPMLLLHMEGTDEAQIFKDSSKYIRTVTTFGNAKTDSAQFKFGTTSAYFDGTGDAVTIPDSADYELGTSDFTIQCWFRPERVTGDQQIFGKRGSGNYGLSLTSTDTNMELLVSFDGSTWGIDTGAGSHLGTIAVNTWYHVAVTRSGNIIRGFLNGALLYTSGTIGTVWDNTADWGVGGNWTTGTTVLDPFQGWIDEASIELGVARWTAAFTPPTQPYGSESRQYAIRFKSETNAVTTKMKSARLVSIELTSDDVIAEALASNTTTNNSTSTVTRVTANITVPTGGGTYWIAESCHLWDNVPSGNMSAMRFKVDGTVQLPGASGETSATWIVRSPSDNTQRTPGIVFVNETLTAGAHTVLLTYDTGGSTGTTGIEQARILMLRLDDGRFGEYFYKETAWTDVVGSTTYTSKILVSNTFSGGDYLLLGGMMYSQSSTANSAYAQMLLDNSTTLIETVNEVVSFQYFSRSPCWIADVATLSAGAHTLDAQQKNEAGTANFQAMGAVLALQLPAAEAEVIPYGFYMGYMIV